LQPGLFLLGDHVLELLDHQNQRRVAVLLVLQLAVLLLDPEFELLPLRRLLLAQLSHLS